MYGILLGRGNVWDPIREGGVLDYVREGRCVGSC